MTINYTADVANGSSFGCFWKILLRWKGSVYKLIWRELAAYLCMYFIISFSYRYGMDEPQRGVFEKVKVYCSKQLENIPMSFVLGFYVTLIVKRWWDQYWILPLPDAVALFISSSIHGQDERGRILRRTIMRYLVLAYIIMLQRISFRVKKRFPSLQHLVDAGLMMESEKAIFDTMNAKTKVNKFWIPIVWSTNLVNRARAEGRITSDHMVQSIITELNEFRRKLGRVNVFDTISVPLVYTQVVTMAVYTYFIAALLGHQWVQPKDPKLLSTIYPAQEFDLYFPIFLCLQFVFYIGWLKVAETLINPFGEDDDDFEINWLIDRHIQVSYMVVDEIHDEHPELLKDQYWDQVVPQQLPYNTASENFRRAEPLGSTASMKLKPKDTVYDHLTPKRHASMIPDEVYADYESVTDSPLVDSRKSWIQRQLSRVESFRSTSSSSSLFNRHRASANNHNNGGFHVHHAGAGGHRLSLYEKLMNRRSSKDHNAMRSKVAATYQTKAAEKDLTINTNLPYSGSRPRVPTPDVAKETNDQKFMNSRNPSSPRHLTNSGVQNNYGGGVTLMYPGKVLPTVYGQTSLGLHGLPSPRSKSPLSSLYDTNESQLGMLSPIEENDGSPYSTSSTGRSVKSSSNYPTTTAIFGRKPSPPPPQDELPPIPNEKHNSNGSPPHKKSDTHVVDLSKVFEDLKETVIGNNLNSSVESEEPYMTIAEIAEIQNETSNAKSGQSRVKSQSTSSRERKLSMMGRQDAVVVEEDHNVAMNRRSVESSPRHSRNDLPTESDKAINNDHNHSRSGHSTRNSLANNNENEEANGEILLTSEVLGDKISNSVMTGDHSVRSSNSSEANSRKTSETTSIASRSSDSSSRKVSDGRPQSTIPIRSKKTSEISNISQDSLLNLRKLSEASNNLNLSMNSRKTSEISESGTTKSRKFSDITNNRTSVGNSRKSSDISTSGISMSSSRKTSESPGTGTRSRKTSEMPEQPRSDSRSRRTSDMSTVSNSINSRKVSSASSNPASASANDSTRSSPTPLSDSRRTSESSVISSSSRNTDATVAVHDLLEDDNGNVITDELNYEMESKHPEEEQDEETGKEGASKKGVFEVFV